MRTIRNYRNAVAEFEQLGITSWPKVPPKQREFVRARERVLGRCLTDEERVTSRVYRAFPLFHRARIAIRQGDDVFPEIVYVYPWEGADDPCAAMWPKRGGPIGVDFYNSERPHTEFANVRDAMRAIGTSL